MRKLCSTAVVVLVFAASLTAQITIPFNFTAGTVIDPDQMNQNFTAVATACNRTGCTMTGVLKVLAGVAGAPGIANGGDPTTGEIIGAGSIGWSLSGTQRMLLNASGLTVYGLNILNNTGKIPALTTTYFTSVDGSALTNLTAPNLVGALPAISGALLTTLNASNLTSGTAAVARLGSGSPSAANFLRGDGAWAAITAAKLGYTVTTQTAGPYTATTTDEVILASNTFTVNLFTCVGNANRALIIKNVGTGTITIDGNAAETIDGSPTFTNSTQNQSITLVCDGSNWSII